MYPCLFTATCAGGLIATTQIAPLAHEFGLASTSVSFLGMTLPLLTLTLSINNLANGLTRPLSGFISDRIGRENVMLIVFVGEGVALLGLVMFGANPVAFLVSRDPLLILGRAYAITSLWLVDTFIETHQLPTQASSTRAGGICVPLGSFFAVNTGGWTGVFIVCAAVSVAMGLLSKLVLAPMRSRFIERTNAAITGVAFERAVAADASEPIASPASAEI